MKEQHQKVKQEKLELNAKLDAHLQHWKLLCVCVCGCVPQIIAASMWYLRPPGSAWNS